MQGEAQRETSSLGIVFYVSLAIAIVFVLWGVLFTENLSNVTNFVLDFVITSFGWLYLLAATLFLGFVVYLGLSRFGKIRLGSDDERPEFGVLSWFAMLFAAGMGIGLVFWGVAEPISHLETPPYGIAGAGTSDAADLGMQYSFFHWGLHPWAIYSVVALSIAYFNFRRGRKGLISSVFYPLLGDRVDGPIGKFIDVLAIFATLFGVAVSLGLGALQINGGLSYLFEVPSGAGIQIIIIGIITVLFMASAVTGIDKGIRYLSTLNMFLAASLLLFIFVLGPTVLLLNIFTQVSGSYLGDLIPISVNLDAFDGSAWAQDWTLFYWATWIAWSPYVGAFIARISRGRTIRQFVAGVLLVPSVLSFLWFSVFGGTGIILDQQVGGTISSAVAEDEAVALFVMLNELPLALITSLIGMVLVAVFFITSADSASFVLGSMSSGGSLNPRAAVKLVWGAVISSFAAVLLLSGGLDALQRVAIIAAVPFTVVMLGMCVSLFLGLRTDPEIERERERERGTGSSPTAQRGLDAETTPGTRGAPTQGSQKVGD